MAGSLGELVVKVSANADRFKADMAKMSGHVDKFAKDTKTKLGVFGGPVGQGILQGLGMGTAIQGVSMVTRAVGDLGKEIGKAVISGKDLGTAILKWGENLSGIQTPVGFLDNIQEAEKSLSKINQGIDERIAKMTGGRVMDDSIKALLANRGELEKQRNEVSQRGVVSEFARNFFTLGLASDKHDELDSLNVQIKSLDALIKVQQERLQGAEKFAAEQKRVAETTREAESALQAMMDRGASLKESLRNPQEQFNASVTDTLKLLEVGAINFGTYERAIRGASDALDKTAVRHQAMEAFKATTQGVAAVQAGTSAGFSAVQAANRQQSDLARWQKENDQRMLAVQKDQAASLKRIEAALATGRNIMPPPIDL